MCGIKARWITTIGIGYDLAMDPKTAFSIVYEKSLWSRGETRSGRGSTRAYTRQLRRSIPMMLDLLDCRSVLDAPCGDFNWMRGVNLGGRPYIGADIVPSMIDDLRTNHPTVDFRVLDITQDSLPEADLWLCRDVLFHMSVADVQRVLDNFLRSNIKYLMTSHFLDCEANGDSPTSPITYHPRNLTKPPFNWPQPDYCLKDWVPDEFPRWLGVWKRGDVMQALGGGAL